MSGMRSAIAEIKTTPPRMSAKTLPRRQLFAKMDGFASHPLTVIVAPPGFGKTTLLALWANRCKHLLAWLSLSKEDASPQRFFAGLQAALHKTTRKTKPDIGGKVIDGADQVARIDILVDFLASFPKELFCVIDGFHHLDGCKDVLDGLNYLLDNSPPNLHLVVASRSLPALRINKRRLESGLGEIDASELLFSPAEFGHYLTLNGISAPVWFLDEAQEMVAGLPAAAAILVALLRHHKTDEELKQVPARFKEMLRQYFSEEYLDSLPEDLRQLVASVSFLPEFSSSLAQWQSRGFLASVSDEFICESIRFLKERGLLSERMDGVGRSWYRLHPLLADAMSSGWLVQGGSWERSLYRRASTWYLCEGMLEEAVQLASGARDWDAIRDIILENWRKKFEEDELSCLLNWLSLLPEDYVKRYPKLCLFAILPLGVGGDFERARKWFTRAKKLSKVEGDRYSASADALYSLVLSMEGKLDKSYELAQRAIEWLPDEDADLKAMVSQTLGSSLSPPDIVGAYEMIKEAEMTQKTGTDRNVRCSLFANLALIEAQLGLDSAAIKHIRLAREMSSHQADRVSPMLAFAQLAEGITAYHKGNLSAARNLLSEAIELFRFNYVPRHIAFAKALLSAILIQTGRRGEAMELIEQACLLEQMSIADTFPGLIPLSGWLASDAFNDFNAQQMFGGCAAGGIAHRWLMLSCAFVEGAKLGFAQIDNLEHAIDPTRFPLAFINTLLLKGAVAERAGRAELSVQALSRAVDMAAREHTIQPFFDAHSSIKKSLKTLARTQPEGFAAVIFRQLPKHAETISGAAIDVSVQQKLSSRELDVMRIIDTGLSIHQTAERLFISPETVKKHLVHIYAKLKVHSRYEALTVLRKQGLL